MENLEKVLEDLTVEQLEATLEKKRAIVAERGFAEAVSNETVLETTGKRPDLVLTVADLEETEKNDTLWVIPLFWIFSWSLLTVFYTILKILNDAGVELEWIKW